MRSNRPDFYAALGVLRDATPEEIKRAYYAAARRLHFARSNGSCGDCLAVDHDCGRHV